MGVRVLTVLGPHHSVMGFVKLGVDKDPGLQPRLDLATSLGLTRSNSSTSTSVPSQPIASKLAWAGHVDDIY